MKPIKLQANNINCLAAKIHKQNHKWWHDAKGNPIKRDAGELLMLVVTELAEHVEGFRRDLLDDHVTHRKMDEIEMADAVIRILDFAAGFRVKIKFRTHNKSILIDKQANRCGQVLNMTRNICTIALYHDDRMAGFLIGALIQNIKMYCNLHKLNLGRAIAEKLAYNRTRADHTHEARAKANGKKF